MASSIHDQTGISTNGLGVAQKTGRKSLKIGHRMLFQAVEQSPNMIAIMDSSGTVEYVNPKFIETTGYSLQDVLGSDIRVLLSPTVVPEEYKSVWNTISAGREWKGEYQNSAKDGRLFWESQTILPLKNEKNQITHFLSTKEDITLRKSLEEQLRHAQKLEAVGRLAGGVAHDFNNFLTIIIGYAEMVAGDFSPKDPLFAEIQEIKHAGERASVLVRQLVAFSRRQVHQPVVLDLNQIVKEFERMLRRLLGEDVTLETNLSANLGQVLADAGQIEQVIANLAMNSRDAMPNGGHVFIRTSNVEIALGDLSEQMQIDPGPYVILEIADTGSGMTPETVAKLFDPFFTTKERGKGTGLGLSTVYGIIRQSGGGIRVQSEPGKGTAFFLYLPTAKRVQQGSISDSVATELPKGKSAVLVVEDEPTVRKFTVDTLSRNGYTVFDAKNPEDALSFCAGYDSRLDLLLTDIVMPGINGRDLANRIYGLYPGMKVLFMSGYADSAVELTAALDPGRGFLPKPFTPQKLLRKVQHMLQPASVPVAGVAVQKFKGTTEDAEQTRFH